MNLSSLSYQPKSFDAPELKIAYSSILIDVPAGRAKEAIDLYAEKGASGFYFNGFRGSGQEVVDEVLARVNPKIVGISGVVDFDFSSIYRNRGVSELILGYKMPWPEFDRLERIKSFSALSIDGLIESIPACIESLDLQKFSNRNLFEFEKFKRLKKLRLGHAGRLVTLDGLPSSVVELDLSYCPKLCDIDALAGCMLESLIFDHCKKISSYAALYGQIELRHMLLSDLGQMESIEFVKKLHKLSSFNIHNTIVKEGR